MAYLVKADLKTHIYSTVLDEIDRGDATIITLQIDAAVAEAKSYCRRFDLVKLFTDTDPNFVNDKNLLDKVKDLACWKIIKLANPNVNIELFRQNYEDAIQWFVRVQTGKADPGWPVPADDTTTDRKEGSEIQFESNTKRSNHY
jgi:hypothetical protein